MISKTAPDIESIEKWFEEAVVASKKGKKTIPIGSKRPNKNTIAYLKGVGFKFNKHAPGRFSTNHYYLTF